MARNMILQSGKEAKITQCQVWAVWQIFQDCPPEALQQLCVAVATWGRVLLCVVSCPGHCHLMAACNHSRVVHYVNALTVVAFFMKSTNRTTLQSQNTIAITLQADWYNLNYLDRGDPECCQSMLARLVSRSEMNQHLISTDNAFQENMTMNGILSEERESSKNFCGLWSSDSTYGTHHTQTLCVPNSWIILLIVPCDRASSHSSSLSHSSAIPDCLPQRALCFQAACCCWSAVCHFSHNPSSRCDRMWTLNIISPHFDDSTLLPCKLWLADDQAQLQNVPSTQSNYSTGLLSGSPFQSSRYVQLKVGTLCEVHYAANCHSIPTNTTIFPCNRSGHSRPPSN